MSADAETEQHIREVFNRFDNDKSGRIKPNELLIVMQDIDPEFWTEERINILLEEMEKHRDNAVDFHAFLSWVLAEEDATFVEEDAFQGTMFFYGDEDEEFDEDSVYSESEYDNYSAASEPVDFEFNFDPDLYPSMNIENIPTVCQRCKDWGDAEGEDSSLIIYDGYMQSIENKSEPIMVCFIRDPRLYESEGLNLTELGINSVGFLIDSIERDTGGEGSLFQFLVGRSEGDHIYAWCYPRLLKRTQKGGDLDDVAPMQEDAEETFPTEGDAEEALGEFKISPTSIWPKRLMHFIKDPHGDRPGTYRGAWAVVDTEWDDAENRIKHYQHEMEDLEDDVTESCLTGDLKIIMAGLMQVVDSKIPEGPKMTASNAFEALLYTCKMNAMMCLQSKKTNAMALAALVEAQRGMEEIFTACTTKLSLFMMKNEKAFVGMDGPLDEIIGQGMGYTGLMYSSRFNIVLTICLHLEVALSVIRDYFNETFGKIEGLEYEVKPWNSKSTSSIYTKITDYAAKKIDPSVLSACGLLGIKDYLRTRMIVPPGGSAKKCVDDFLDKIHEAISPEGGAIENRVYKDKSFRFKPDGQALYVTGYLLLPFPLVLDGVNAKFKPCDPRLDPQNEDYYDPRLDRDSDKYDEEYANSPQIKREERWREYGFEWKIHVCKEEAGLQDVGKFAMPFEIQVVNAAALKFIDAMHHSYEIQRVSARISAVCPCTKDKKGDTVAQTQCRHCMYRRSQGFGYCPFCHICFNSKTQQMHCTKPCCTGKETGEVTIEAEIKDMDVEKLRMKILEMEKELKACRELN